MPLLPPDARSTARREGSLIVANAHRILRGEEPELPPSAATATARLLLLPAPRTRAQRAERAGRGRHARASRDASASTGSTTCRCSRRCTAASAASTRLNERLRAALRRRRRASCAGAARAWRDGRPRDPDAQRLREGGLQRRHGPHRAHRRTRAARHVRYPEREVRYARERARATCSRPSRSRCTARRAASSRPSSCRSCRSTAMMLQRNLLYTAVTRARRLVVLVGSRRALRMAVENAEQRGRESAPGRAAAAGLSDARAPSAKETGVPLRMQRNPGDCVTTASVRLVARARGRADQSRSRFPPAATQAARARKNASAGLARPKGGFALARR